jgi:glycosyltransferase involved in cell wall biosynthesis
MKVLMLAYTFYETDNRVKRYAETLARRGDRVDVVVLQKPGQARYEVVNGVHLYRIQRRVFNEKSSLDYLFRLLLFVVKSGLCASWRQIRYGYDLVHVHSIPDFEVFAALLPKLMGAKVILDIHDIVPELYCSKFGVDLDSFLFKALVWVEKLSTRFADHVIIANHLWEKRLVERSVPSHKCSVYLNYPDTGIFRKQENPQKNATFTWIYPGTLNWHQGLDVAIRAFPRVLDQFPDTEFHIYGDGSEKENLIRLADQLGLKGKVRFMDRMPIDEIAKVMATADLAVVPKRKDSFGDQAFSTKIFEFMSLGVPVVAADTTVDRHYFDDSTVRFFQSGDEADLANQVISLMSDEGQRIRQVQCATEYVQKHTWEMHKDRYLDLVDSICFNHKRVTPAVSSV